MHVVQVWMKLKFCSEKYQEENSIMTNLQDILIFNILGIQTEKRIQ